MLLTKRIFKALLFTALLAPLVVFDASADTVTFDLLDSGKQPNNPILNIGDTFSVDIVGQAFTELSGGIIDLGYDDTIVEILSVQIDPYWDFEPDTGAKDPGASRWLGIAFDVFANSPAVGDFVIATLHLETVGGGVSPLEILPSSEFYSATALLVPNIVNGSVTVVPLPAALWLMVSALGGLVTVGYRRRSGV